MAEFNNYSDVQAALNREYEAWKSGKSVGRTEEGQRARDWWSGYSAPSAPPASPPLPPPPPIPPLPIFNKMTTPDKNIKSAPSDIIQFDDNAIDIALMQDLLYEDIGAVELANISRTDLIDGQDVLYSPIRNLSSVRREFNPNNIIATSYSTDYFSRFGIDLIARGVYEPYFDSSGNLIVEIEDVQDGEEIQVQILSSGTISIIEEL